VRWTSVFAVPVGYSDGMRRRSLCNLTAALCFLALIPAPRGALAQTSFASAFDRTPDRVWIGPAYWADPMQDWRIRNGVLECIKAGPDRSVHILTREVASRRGAVTASIDIEAIAAAGDKSGEAWIGFKLASSGRFLDYRDDAVRGVGLLTGLRADGHLFVEKETGATVPPGEVRRLTTDLSPLESGYRLVTRAFGADGRELGTVSGVVPAERTARGTIALVCHNATCGVRTWTVGGSKLDAHEDRAFGPILFTQYTLSRKVLKLTAQMPPVGASEPQTVRLEVERGRGTWVEVGRASIDPLARTATFRLANWDDGRDHPYRVVYALADRSGATTDHAFHGTIRRDPVDKPQIVVAAFTGNYDLGFPHADVVRHVSVFKPDFLAFTGDQIYEPVGGFGVVRSPLDMAVLDYLRKWYMFGWEYWSLLKDIPSVALPDDHDVYHGNIWGAGGRDANEGPQKLKQDNGGYTMPVEWVNMVQRTQTSHMPDPVDPAPLERGINVYFTELVWGGVSFAILEDRAWKSAPAILLPEADIVNGWAHNPDWDAAKQSDVPGAELLGPRQERFLGRWADDWSGGVWMKSVISQTLFANLATLPKGARADDITPKLPVLPAGAYAEGEAPVADHDSDGWPQTARLRALRLMQKAKALHIAGDQHLGSTIQYGLDGFRDGPYAICVPSVSNFWPRRWFPAEPGQNRAPGAPRYTGDYLDGFGNKITVLAVANPHLTGIPPEDINDRAPGYGIITFDRASRKITLANWPRWVDPSQPDAKPYPGWPVTVAPGGNDR
jgi:alkaline phosphatase D